MSEKELRQPIGFIGTCKCGRIVAAMDYTRMKREDAAKELGEWLCSGYTVTPKFESGWSATLQSCICKD